MTIARILRAPRAIEFSPIIEFVLVLAALGLILFRFQQRICKIPLVPILSNDGFPAWHEEKLSVW